MQNGYKRTSNFVDGFVISKVIKKTHKINNKKLMSFLQIATTTMAELATFHKNMLDLRQESHLYEGHLMSICVSLDGVAYSEKGKRTNKFVVVRFGRHHQYLYAAHNHLTRNPEASPSLNLLLQKLIREINADPRMKLIRLLCDMPQRCVCMHVCILYKPYE